MAHACCLQAKDLKELSTPTGLIVAGLPAAGLRRPFGYQCMTIVVLPRTASAEKKLVRRMRVYQRGAEMDCAVGVPPNPIPAGLDLISVCFRPAIENIKIGVSRGTH